MSPAVVREAPARPFIHFAYSGELRPLVHLPLPAHCTPPCSSQVSVLHEVRVSDKEHVNHLIVQPPFLQSVHHPESQTSIQRSSGRSHGRRDLRTPGADGDSRPSTQQTVRVQQRQRRPELKEVPGCGEAMGLALRHSWPQEGTGQVHKKL